MHREGSKDLVLVQCVDPLVSDVCIQLTLIGGCLRLLGRGPGSIGNAAQFLDLTGKSLSILLCLVYAPRIGFRKNLC